MCEPFVLGVNYWPRRKAMGWWSEFDAGEVREEFALIAELGLTVVRLFLLWDDFQPTPDTVDPACLTHLITVADIAADLGLGLDVTFFTGHMSGPNWSPGWLLGEGVPPTHYRQLVSGGQIVPGPYRNPYTDPAALAAERLQLRRVVGALKDHPALWMWNLGNEPDLFAWPPDDATGQGWVQDMTGLIKEIDPVHPVTCGLHMANLGQHNHLRVDQVFAETDVAVMHAYPMYAADLVGNPLDPDMVPFTCALTAALGGKPVLMEEFGGCTAPPGRDSFVMEWMQLGKPRGQFMAGEEALADYLRAVLPRLIDVGTTGALIWCFADYAEALWDRPPCSEFHHERFFGLVRPDGSLKPHAQVLKDFAATKPVVKTEGLRTLTLDVTPDEYYADPWAHLPRLYQQFTGRALPRA
jgi:endo-1,4-beta-mannosidase